MIIGVREVLQSMSNATCDKVNVPGYTDPRERARGMRRKKLLASLCVQHAKGTIDRDDLAEYVAIAKVTQAVALSHVKAAYADTVKAVAAK